MSRALTSGTGLLNSDGILTGWPFSVFFWIKQTTYTAFQTMMRYSSNGSDYAEFYSTTATGQAYFREYLGTTNAVVVGATPTYAENTWTPVVLRADTAVTKYDTDIASGSATTNKVAWGTPEATLAILSRTDGTQSFVGKVAYYTKWGVVLSDVNSAALIAGTNPALVDAANHLALWDFQSPSLIDSINSYVLSAGSTSYDPSDNPTLAGGGTTWLTTNFWWDSV